MVSERTAWREAFPRTQPSFLQETDLHLLLPIRRFSPAQTPQLSKRESPKQNPEPFRQRGGLFSSWFLRGIKIESDVNIAQMSSFDLLRSFRIFFTLTTVKAGFHLQSPRSRNRVFVRQPHRILLSHPHRRMKLSSYS